MKSYSELLKLKTFEERFEYLKLSGKVAERTFGGSRYLNQLLYKDPMWKSTRDKIISRDKGCDLAHEDHELASSAYVHHINPIKKEDVLFRAKKVFDPENLITVSFNTHQAIHYGNSDMIPKDPIERRPNDTIPWR